MKVKNIKNQLATKPVSMPIGNGEYNTYNDVFEKIAEQVHTTPKQSTRKYKFKNTSL